MEKVNSSKARYHINYRYEPLQWDVSYQDSAPEQGWIWDQLIHPHHGYQMWSVLHSMNSTCISDKEQQAIEIQNGQHFQPLAEKNKSEINYLTLMIKNGKSSANKVSICISKKQVYIWQSLSLQEGYDTKELKIWAYGLWTFIVTLDKVTASAIIKTKGWFQALECSHVWYIFLLFQYLQFGIHYIWNSDTGLAQWEAAHTGTYWQ